MVWFDYTSGDKQLKALEQWSPNFSSRKPDIDIIEPPRAKAGD